MSNNLAQSDPAEGSREVIDHELARMERRRTASASRREPVLTRADILAAIRDADDHVVAEIVATGATLGEFRRALAWLDDDDAARDAGLPPPSGRAARVLSLLREVEAQRTEAEDR